MSIMSGVSCLSSPSIVLPEVWWLAYPTCCTACCAADNVVGGCVEAATSNVQWVAVLMRCEDVSMYTTFFSIALAEEYACGHMAVKFVGLLPVLWTITEHPNILRCLVAGFHPMYFSYGVHVIAWCGSLFFK